MRLKAKDAVFKQGNFLVCWVRCVEFIEIEKLYEKLTRDGVDTLSDYRNGEINEYSERVWEMLSKRDQEAVNLFMLKMQAIEWSWILKRDEDQ